jgi:hypothetical protein
MIDESDQTICVRVGGIAVEGTPPSCLKQKERWSDANAAAQVKSRLWTAKGAKKRGVAQYRTRSQPSVTSSRCTVRGGNLHGLTSDPPAVVVAERDACCSVGKKTIVLFRWINVALLET